MFHSFLQYFLDRSHASTDCLSLDSSNLETTGKLQQYFNAWLKTLDLANFESLRSRLLLSGIDNPNKLENFFYALPLVWEISASQDQKCSLDWLLEAFHASLSDSDEGFSIELPREISELPFAKLWTGVYLNAWNLISQGSDFQDCDLILGVEFDPTPTVINLITNLSRIFESTLFCEFKKFRSIHSSSSTSTSPDDSTLLYDQFIYDLKVNRFKAFFKKYPCLLFRASNTVLHWKQSVILFLRRFVNHCSDIANFLGLSSDMMIRSFSPGFGDQHNGGQSASLIRLFDVSQKRDYYLIYKPVSLDMFQAYNNFVAQLNQLGCPYPFKCVRSISFTGYGYIEYIPYISCKSSAEFDQYYLNFGALTAVLYLLRANDCHYENIIANHTHPVLVDCETLMQPYFSEGNDETDYVCLREGIQRTGLIGSWIWVAYSSASVDIGAIGIQNKSLENISIWSWQNLNTDHMNLVRESNPVVSISCHPSVECVSEESVKRKHQLVIQGFSDLASFLAELEDQRSLTALVKQSFSGLSARVLIRDTGDYGRALNRANSPHYASSFFRSGMLFEQLLNLFIHRDQFKKLYRIYYSEIKQLEMNDIPIFFMKTNSTHLEDASEEPLMVDYAQLSALDAVLHSISRLRIEFSDQLILLDKYLSISLMQDVILPQRIAPEIYPDSGVSINHPDVLCLDAAFECADLLLHQCLELSNGLLWSKLEIDEARHNLSLEPLSSSLYDGCLGIIVFLDELASKTNYLSSSPAREKKVKLVMELFLDPLLVLILESPNYILEEWISKASLGLNGIGGCLLAFYTLSYSTYLGPYRVQLILKAIEIIIASLQGFTFRSTSYDLMSGTAGLLSGLLCINDGNAMEIGYELGRRLLAAQRIDGAWSKSGDRIAQVGFAHGSCGIASALSRLYQITNDSIFEVSALKGFAYQNQFFDHCIGNWPDLRSFSAEIRGFTSSAKSQPNVFSSSWCAGSAGVLLSRLIARNSGLSWESLDSDIEAGLRASLLGGGAERFHLCCGVSGRLSVVALLSVSSVCWSISKVDQVSMEKFKAEALEQLILALRAKSSAIAATGLSNVLDIAPGLFDGLAGIGMTCIANARSNSASKLAQLISAGLYLPSNQ